MTRVAVVEPFFRTSGVTTYAHHLAEGFRQAGCDVDLVTFTLSGKERSGDTSSRQKNGNVKSGWQWSPYKGDYVRRWSEAKATFDEYDFVFLNEPRCAPLDKRAMRKLGKGDIKIGRQRIADHEIEYLDVPEYIRALSESKTPWGTCMHDPGYGRKLAPFLPQLLELATPSVIMTHRPQSLESAQWAIDEAGLEEEATIQGWEEHPLHEVRTPFLPYVSRPLENTADHTFGMTGRYINNKGQPTLVGLAATGRVPAGWTVRIGGASPLGAGPNHTFLTYESLTVTHYDYPGKREGNGNVTTGDPWEVPGIAAYDGPYDDAVDYSARAHAVHVNATEVGFSGVGSLEYADLEAVDAGCLLVLPHHRNVPEVSPTRATRGLTHSDTRGITDPGAHPPEDSPIEGAYVASEYDLVKCLNAELYPIDLARTQTLSNLAEACRLAANDWTDTKRRASIVDYNQSVMRELSDPKKYAELVLSEGLR